MNIEGEWFAFFIHKLRIIFQLLLLLIIFQMLIVSVNMPFIQDVPEIDAGVVDMNNRF